MPFDGLAVLSLESRRAPEMQNLIANQGGRPFVAPSMREVPIEQNQAAFDFAERLFNGKFDLIILLTGVGTRYLDKVLAARYPPEKFREALRKIAVVARGPKPVAVCRELEIPVTLVAPEPNTWREVLDVMQSRSEKRIAVQEYGRSNPELLEALRERGAEVTAVPVYQWDLPEDTGPLETAVRRLAAREFDATLFTTATQVDHLFMMAERLHLAGDVRAGLDWSVVASIGPTTDETLAEHGITPDFAPSHPKMGMLVVELAREIHDLIKAKRQTRL